MDSCFVLIQFCFKPVIITDRIGLHSFLLLLRIACCPGLGDFFMPTSRWRTLTSTAIIPILKLILRKISRKNKVKKHMKGKHDESRTWTSNNGVAMYCHSRHQPLNSQYMVTQVLEVPGWRLVVLSFHSFFLTSIITDIDHFHNMVQWL